jgi:hypothetical protein
VTTEPAAARTPACLARRFARRWLALLVVLGGCSGKPSPSPDAALDGARGAEVQLSLPDVGTTGTGGAGDAGSATGGSGGQGGSAGSGGQGGTGSPPQQGYQHLRGPCDVPGRIVMHEARLAPCPGGCATGCPIAYCLCEGGQWQCACPTCPSLDLGDRRLACRDCAAAATCDIPDAGAARD